ncbi:endolytic transglycosylase MltG [Pseudomonas sp. 15A4]|uniref:endolytic transglycosylase MltG n=1 Tax=Pseudomonas sp. 15A4 TaxID=2804761 RepID=UPI00196772FB|nr:endolytic transglycosylase MltG [Pseudomonas sp. 15A4]QSB21553.1 endolytic transglycosylase MltG [Pseudomonas sp. 15A4]
MIRKLLVLLETGVVLAGLLLGVAYWQQSSALQQSLNLTQEKLLDVPAGSSPTGVLNRLQADGVIKDAFWLRLYWRFNLQGQSLHSGEYRMVPGMNAESLLDLWQKGEVVQYSVTLVEGWTFRQVRAALARQVKLEQTASELSDTELMAKLGHPDVFPEGRFFPDTYRYVRGMTDVELLKQAYNRLDEVLQEEWEKRAADVPYTDAYQALIMASLVEKETGVPQERGQIAGVFVRRLQQGMLLQTDPTVIYGLGDRYNGKITRALLKEATPYNTYVISGLPPTPISMVGREAIHAAMHPVAGNSLYFVARGDGSHVFSADLDAHNAAVKEFQLKRRADYRSSPAPVVAPAAPADSLDKPASEQEPLDSQRTDAQPTESNAAETKSVVSKSVEPSASEHSPKPQTDAETPSAPANDPGK